MRHDESAELKARISNLPDEELLDMVEAEPFMYRQEALDYASAELTRRGIEFQESDEPSEDEGGSASNPSKVVRRLTSCKNIAEAGLLKGLLTERGIACEIKGTYLSMGLGELPFTECYPEIWVAGEEEFETAKGILQEWRSQEVAPQESWRCAQCGEENEGQFTSCWQCGWTKPDRPE